MEESTDTHILFPTSLQGQHTSNMVGLPTATVTEIPKDPKIRIRKIIRDDIRLPEDEHQHLL